LTTNIDHGPTVPNRTAPMIAPITTAELDAAPNRALASSSRSAGTTSRSNSIHAGVANAPSVPASTLVTMSSGTLSTSAAAITAITR
jgi:hypothetical protein